MLYCILSILTFYQTGDTTAGMSAEKSRSYTREVITNAAIGLGFGVGSGAFYLLGNKAYENYQRSGSMKAANEYYNQSVLYDNARNVCLVGAVFFLARAVYYQIKSPRPAKTVGLRPVLDIGMPEYAKVQLGFKRAL